MNDEDGSSPTNEKGGRFFLLIWVIPILVFLYIFVKWKHPQALSIWFFTCKLFSYHCGPFFHL